MPKNLVSTSQTEFQRGDGQFTTTSAGPLLPIAYPAGASNGYVWTSDASGNGSWQVAAGGLGLTVTSVQTSNCNALANQLVPVDTTSGNVTVTLPNAPAAGTLVIVKMVTQASAHTVTIACAGSDVFNKSGGATTGTLTLLAQGQFLEYNGSGIWTVLADDLPLSQIDLRYAELANNLSDLPNAGTARTNLGLGTAATQASSAFLQPSNNLSDVGTAATALSNLGGLPLGGGTMSGAIAMGSHKVTGLTNGSASTDAAAYGQTLAGGSGSPLTTLGDILYENATPAPARLGGNTTTQVEFLSSAGTGSAANAPAWSTVSGQYLCTPSSYAPASQTVLGFGSATFAVPGLSTTVAAGSNGGEISTVASWSAPSSGVLDVASTSGFPSSGTLLIAASATTVATVTYTATAGGNQFTGCAYVSGSATGTVATGGLVSLSGASPVLSTGSFTAPASGDVLVTAFLVAECTTTSTSIAFGLAAHNTVTPMLGNSFVYKVTSAGTGTPVSMNFLVTGLTPGTSYNFDLLGCATTGNIGAIFAFGQTSTTPTQGSGGTGCAVVMTVQGV